MSGKWRRATVGDFGAALSEFVAISAYRIANSPSAPVGKDEMAAFDRVKGMLSDLLGGRARSEESDNDN